MVLKNGELEAVIRKIVHNELMFVTKHCNILNAINHNCPPVIVLMTLKHLRAYAMYVCTVLFFLFPGFLSSAERKILHELCFKELPSLAFSGGQRFIAPCTKHINIYIIFFSV